ncbi:GNAT family N-acetyltransferase [Streptomyces sp. SID13031]|uniref:GNAT family N-acetyltransferase n=1 Tax=Streptomyces sp. SID13031 TaxID=2706046 RepID=UPI0013C8D640|nr:GNAT family N-acetyltransferase [Streptomyces sp. SID13031]NEA37338.1 GNAT family N-acetyltransferase [Streptomyces sp. SID13031]
MTVMLRAAVEADADAIASIWYSGWGDGHIGNVPDELVAVRTKESFWERVPGRISDTTIALAGDEVAGFVMVVGDEVEQVYVSVEHRGSGIAGTLIAEAEHQVKANGHDEAWLAVATGNARARRFYERSGWADGGAFDYPAGTDDRPIPVPCHRYVKKI